MTRVLSLPTEHREVAAAVDAIATNIAESTVRAAAPEEVGGGEWVQFRWLLADGTPFFEGTGRCEACRPLGASGRYDIVLSALKFDPRNEAMFERILLSADQGPRTGKRAPVPKAKVNGTAPERSMPRALPPAKLGALPRAAIPVKTAKPLAPLPRTVTPDLTERARELSRRLNLRAPALARGRWTEDRVIETALRMGFDSLESLLAAHEDDK